MTPGTSESLLGESLVAEGILSSEQLENSLSEQRKTGRMLGEILAEQGVIDSQTVLRTLAKSLEVPHCYLRPGLTDPQRHKLVGLKPVNPSDRVSAGAHLLPIGSSKVIANDQGWISSAAHSPVLGCWLGLGFVKDGRNRIGERLCATDLIRGREYDVEIVSSHFVDPKGERLHG